MEDILVGVFFIIVLITEF